MNTRAGACLSPAYGRGRLESKTSAISHTVRGFFATVSENPRSFLRTTLHGLPQTSTFTLRTNSTQHFVLTNAALRLFLSRQEVTFRHGPGAERRVYDRPPPDNAFPFSNHFVRLMLFEDFKYRQQGNLKHIIHTLFCFLNYSIIAIFFTFVW